MNFFGVSAAVQIEGESHVFSLLLLCCLFQAFVSIKSVDNV
jgi:hypothetical protein